MTFLSTLTILARISSAQKSEKIEWCHVQKLDLPIFAATAHMMEHPFDYPATDGSCVPPTGGLKHFKEQGCPCFDQAEVDAFIATIGDTDACSYESNSYDNAVRVFSRAFDELSGIGTHKCFYVSLHRTGYCQANDFTSQDSDLASYAYAFQHNYVSTQFDGEFEGRGQDCYDILLILKDAIVAANCVIYES